MLCFYSQQCGFNVVESILSVLSDEAVKPVSGETRRRRETYYAAPIKQHDLY